MAIDFGILKTAPTQPQMSIISTPNASMQNAQGILSGASEGASIANAAQANSRANALMPGELQAQQDTHINQGLLQQKTQMDIKAAQYAVQQRQERMDSYSNAEKTGGPKAGLAAVQETLYKQGNVKAGLEMANTMENLQQKIADDDLKGIQATASIALMAQTQAEKDPKTGEYLPGKSPLDVFTKAYPTTKRLDPRAPDPSVFKGDNNLFEDSYVHPVLETAQNPIQAEKARQAELNKNGLYQAQTIRDQQTQELKDAVTKYGPKSQQAIDAADKLQQTLREGTRQSFGGATGTIGAIQNWTNAPPTKGQLIQNYGQQPQGESVGAQGQLNQVTQPTTQAPQTQQPAPVAMPAFNSKAEFQDWYGKQDPATQAAVQSQLGK